MLIIKTPKDPKAVRNLQSDTNLHFISFACLKFFAAFLSRVQTKNHLSEMESHFYWPAKRKRATLYLWVPYCLQYNRSVKDTDNVTKQLKIKHWENREDAMLLCTTYCCCWEAYLCTHFKHLQHVSENEIGWIWIRYLFFFFLNYIKYKQLFQYIFFACYKNVELVYVAAE